MVFKMCWQNKNEVGKGQRCEALVTVTGGSMFWNFDGVGQVSYTFVCRSEKSTDVYT